MIRLNRLKAGLAPPRLCGNQPCFKVGMLDELAKELERRKHCLFATPTTALYVRSERAGARVMASVEHFLDRRLKLRVKIRKSAGQLRRGAFHSLVGPNSPRSPSGHL